jgi:hypothetical protein
MRLLPTWSAKSTRTVRGRNHRQCPEAEQAAYRVYDNSVVPPAFRPKVLEN